MHFKYKDTDSLKANESVNIYHVNNKQKKDMLKLTST